MLSAVARRCCRSWSTISSEEIMDVWATRLIAAMTCWFSLRTGQAIDTRPCSQLFVVDRYPLVKYEFQLGAQSLLAGDRVWAATLERHGGDQLVLLWLG